MGHPTSNRHCIALGYRVVLLGGLKGIWQETREGQAGQQTCRDTEFRKRGCEQDGSRRLGNCFRANWDGSDGLKDKYLPIKLLTMLSAVVSIHQPMGNTVQLVQVTRSLLVNRSPTDCGPNVKVARFLCCLGTPSTDWWAR